MRFAAAETVRRPAPRRCRPQQLQAEDDAVEQVAHVVGDHAQEVVAVRHGVVGTGAFGQEIRVRGRPLVHQQRVQRVRLLLPVAAQSDVGAGPFPADDAVGLGPFAHDGARFRGPLPPERLVVGLDASGAQDGVRDLPGLVDHAVGVTLGGGTVVLQGVVGVLPLRAQAVVRLHALLRRSTPLASRQGDPPSLRKTVHRPRDPVNRGR